MAIPTPYNYRIEDIQEAFNREGKEIISKLTEKYPESTTAHCDIIMNSLQVALCIFFRSRILPEDYGKIVQMISQKMIQNLEDVGKK